MINKLSKTEKGFKSASKTQGVYNYTPDLIQNSMDTPPVKLKPRKINGLEIQFKMLTSDEIEQLRKSKLDEISLKYKEKTNDLMERNSKLINERKQRIKDYIAKAKLAFANNLNSLK